MTYRQGQREITSHPASMMGVGVGVHMKESQSPSPHLSRASPHMIYATTTSASASPQMTQHQGSPYMSQVSQVQQVSPHMARVSPLMSRSSTVDTGSPHSPYSTPGPQMSHSPSPQMSYGRPQPQPTYSSYGGHGNQQQNGYQSTYSRQSQYGGQSTHMPIDPRMERFS